jgi:DNA-binding NarL/FixJ family response regulator
MGPVIAFVDDLMFLSRIREAAQAGGRQVKTARTAAALVEACRDSPHLVLFDLDSARLPITEALEALCGDPSLTDIRSVGFFSHLHAERAQAATAAGCTRVLRRGAFVRELPELLA